MISTLIKNRYVGLVSIVGFQLLLVLPFLGQPIHMDDSIYLDIGRNVLAKPFHAHDFPYCFEGDCAPDMASHSHPPFVGYWIGFLLWLFGDGPRVHVILHLGFLIFPLLFAVSMYRLAQRFSTHPLTITLISIASPAAVVMSHTLMSDYPMLAFWTAAITLYIFGVDRQKPGWLWSSSLLLALGAFCSYPALLAVLVCWFYAWLKKSPLRAAMWVPAIPIAVMILWLGYSSIYFGRLVIAGTTKYFMLTKRGTELASFAIKLIAFPILVSATLSLPIHLVGRSLSWMRGRAAILWGMACACLVQIWASDYSLSEKTLLMLFLGAGGYILFAFGHQCCKNMYDPLSGDNIRNDTVFLLVWVGAVTFCVLFVYSAASARYLLPLLPPFVLLAYRFPVAASSLKYRRWMWLSLAVSLTLALSLSISDFEMAKGHREIGLKLGQLFKGWESQVRFGGEWGFRHYLMENGFRQFTSTSDDMAGGQFVLSPRQAIPYRLPQDVESMLIPFDNLRWDSNFAIRLMNRQAHAGFYSSGWGLLPFVFSQIPIEEVTVQQVSYLVEKLPEITVESSSGDTAIPFPAPKGGIDLQIPLPSRLKIPYQGPWPAGVEFEWIPQKGVLGAGGIPESRLMETVSVAYECAGRRSNIALKLSTPHVPGHQTDSLKLRFDLPEWKAGLIILESRNPGLQELKNASHVLVRNWLIFPPWWPR